uniref:Uncharacterized protein n=1 Tax=Arundo donax TaxID=35708 RepID=A0A0A9CDV2_ARUDO
MCNVFEFINLGCNFRLAFCNQNTQGWHAIL